MIVIYILISVFAVIAFFVIIHKIFTTLEKDKIVPNGKIVQVDGNDMHVYALGEQRAEEPTIVVMSGSSLPSPVYNYKKLYSKFSDMYRVAVPEKLGYGYSDISDSPRDVATILEQTRKALQLSGENAPYILMPHSMSGIEAQLWALKYPKEVVAIIGLDMALPSHYENMNLGFGMSCYKFLTSIVRHIGLQRLPVFQKATGVYDAAALSSEEWQQEKYLIHKMTLNRMIYEEAREILKSSMEVKKAGAPTVPMLLFVSDGKVQKGWINHYNEYIAMASNAEMVPLDCGHMMHNHCDEMIASIVKEYIKNLA